MKVMMERTKNAIEDKIINTTNIEIFAKTDLIQKDSDEIIAYYEKYVVQGYYHA